MSTALGIVIIVLGVTLTWYVFCVGIDTRKTIKEIKPLYVALYHFLAQGSSNSPSAEEKASSAEKQEPVEKNNVDYKKLYPEGTTTGAEDDED